MVKIQLSRKLKRQIATEMDCTLQTVYNALYYYQNSDLSKRIRKRAKEMLYIEAENVVIDPVITMTERSEA